MNYMGAKARIARHIVPHLLAAWRGQPYLEPFVGSCAIAAELGFPCMTLSDLNADLIAMWQALQSGWDPPSRVTEAEWREAKAGKGEPHERAFIGFACSYGGSWFSSFAKNKTNANYAAQGRRSVLRRISRLRHARFLACAYSDHDPDECLVYCDPPYKGTAGYSAVECFDHDLFWETMRVWSRRNTVFVSEYSAPSDFESVASIPRKSTLALGRGTSAIDRLYRWKG